MKKQDERNFAISLRRIYRLLAASKEQKELDDDSVKYWFDALEFAPLDDINQAFDIHIKSERFAPMPADILKLLGVRVNPTPRQLISMARRPRCPLGVIARMKIGTQNLSSSDLSDWELLGEAEFILDDLHGINKRCEEGRYTDQEISIMIKHRVDPRRALTGRAYSKAAGLIESRSIAIERDENHQKMVALPFNKEEDDKKPVNTANVQAIRKSLLGMFDDEPAVAEVIEPICETCKTVTLVRMKMCAGCTEKFVAEKGS